MGVGNNNWGARQQGRKLNYTRFHTWCSVKVSQLSANISAKSQLTPSIALLTYIHSLCLLICRINWIFHGKTTGWFTDRSVGWSSSWPLRYCNCEMLTAVIKCGSTTVQKLVESKSNPIIKWTLLNFILCCWCFFSSSSGGWVAGLLGQKTTRRRVPLGWGANNNRWTHQLQPVWVLLP